MTENNRQAPTVIKHNPTVPYMQQDQRQYSSCSNRWFCPTSKGGNRLLSERVEEKKHEYQAKIGLSLCQRSDECEVRI